MKYFIPTSFSLFYFFYSFFKVYINGVVRESKKLVYPPSSNMSPVMDGYVGGPRGQLGRICMFSKSLSEKEMELIHGLLQSSSFSMAEPCRDMSMK